MVHGESDHLVVLGGRESRPRGEAAIRSLEMAHAPGMRDMDRGGL